jgi:hypothetical protein
VEDIGDPVVGISRRPYISFRTHDESSMSRRDWVFLKPAPSYAENNTPRCKRIGSPSIAPLHLFLVYRKYIFVSDFQLVPQDG